MILGIGNDIIEIKRIEGVIQRFQEKFLDKVFTQKEQLYCQKHRESSRHFAGRFAAKEAIVKAFGTGITKDTSWLDIEIINSKDGKPLVLLSEKLKEQFENVEVLVSISHCKEYATAFAILQKEN